MSVEKQFEMMGIHGKQYGPLTESELRVRFTGSSQLGDKAYASG